MVSLLALRSFSVVGSNHSDRGNPYAIFTPMIEIAAPPDCGRDGSQ
jgi:hypothetical protein